MPISWYPGHMYKANKEMQQLIRQIDVVIEVLDARMPAASANPLLARMRQDKPCLHILNKADLADAEATREWLEWFNSRPGNRAIATDHDSELNAGLIIGICEQLLKTGAADRQAEPDPDADADDTQARPGRRKRQIMITGIPNVGKSTVMNRILGRKIAKTGNEPAVTKGQQRIRLGEHWYLHDTPGVLWPKLEDQDAAYRLACAGAIRNTAMEYEDVAFFAAEWLLADYPQQLRERYQLDELPGTAEALLELIAARRGCLRKNGQPDWHKVSERLLQDYRSGQLGRMTLERPPTGDRPDEAAEQAQAADSQ